MTETVLVTGGTGFVAGWCIAELLARGYAVRTTIRGAGRKEAIDDRVAVVVADLAADEGWEAAVADCDYVLHVASPMSGPAGGDPDALVAAARDGTLRVLRAAAGAGVRRVVMTSSTAAATPCAPASGTAADETVWTDLGDRSLNPYRRSKVIAERAAWDFMARYDGPMTLATVLPVAVFGPLRPGANRGSVEVIERLLNGRPPVLPRFGFSIVDVRDLADLHLRAMTEPAAAGRRYIASGGFLWYADIAHVLRSRLGARAAKVPTRGVPDIVVRGLAGVIPALRPLTPLLGRDLTFSADRAHTELGFAPRPVETTIVDCAATLAERSA